MLSLAVVGAVDYPFLSTAMPLNHHRCEFWVSRKTQCDRRWFLGHEPRLVEGDAGTGSPWGLALPSCGPRPVDRLHHGRVGGAQPLLACLLGSTGAVGA
jgi:hypothetical protein